MKYKYEDLEEVVAKRDFELFLRDEYGEIERVVTVPMGCKGVIEQMGWSSVDNFRVSYGILFLEGETEISASIFEEDMELYFDIERER